MQHDRRSPWEVWCSAPWYEQVGMAAFLGLHVYCLIRIFIW